MYQNDAVPLNRCPHISTTLERIFYLFCVRVAGVWTCTKTSYTESPKSSCDVFSAEQKLWIIWQSSPRAQNISWLQGAIQERCTKGRTSCVVFPVLQFHVEVKRSFHLLTWQLLARLFSTNYLRLSLRDVLQGNWSCQRVSVYSP